MSSARRLKRPWPMSWPPTGVDAQATLAATIDGRTLAAIGDVAGANTALGFHLAPHAEKRLDHGGLVVVGSLSPGEQDSRNRYTLSHLHAKGGMGRVWLARDG